MEITAEGRDSFVLRLSADELRLIHGALREICFGIASFEFEARLGTSPDAMKALAAGIRDGVNRVGLEL